MSEASTDATGRHRRGWLRFGRDVAVQVIGSIIAVGLPGLIAYLLAG